MGQASPNNSERRLDSWKEIAAFFGRDERTVRRWEKENVLPVHRVPGGSKGRVFAYESELRRWLSTPQAVERPSGEPGPQLQVQPDGMHFSLRFPAKWAAAFALCVALATGVFAYRKDHRFAVHAAVAPASFTPARDPRKPSTPEAEDFYLQGRYYWNKRTPEDLNKAVDLFTQSIVQDPGYAPAYVGLADCYNLLREYAAMPPSEAYPRAFAAAKKAVELDTGSSPAHASLAFASFFGMWDLETGEREFGRAIALDPSDPVPHHWWANGLLALHRLPEALAEIDRAQALDPSSSAILADKGNILLVAGHRDEAVSLLQRVEMREPDFRSPHLYLKCAYFRNQDYPNFLVEARQDALVVHDDAALAIATAGEKGFATGGKRGMLLAMRDKEETLYARRLVPPTELAWVYAALGNRDEALRYLNAAYQQRDGALLFVEIYSEFDGLHGLSEYRDLLARIGLPL